MDFTLDHVADMARSMTLPRAHAIIVAVLERFDKTGVEPEVIDENLAMLMLEADFDIEIAAALVNWGAIVDMRSIADRLVSKGILIEVSPGRYRRADPPAPGPSHPP